MIDALLPISRAACVGGGVIGSGWAARLLWHGIDVTVCDPHPKAKIHCCAVLKNAERALLKLHGSRPTHSGTIHFTTDIEEAVNDADFIQESAPESVTLKHQILAEIDAHAMEHALIGTSTSGLLPTILQSVMQRPDRLVVAHPFNPVYLLPLVEVCGGEKTSGQAVRLAKDLFQALGMYPLHIRREIDGFIADRLLEALWREALWLVNDDIATVSEVDDAIRYGAGLRWAMMGSFMTYRIAGGEDGMRHFMAQFGPALKWPWTKLMDVPDLTDELLDKIAKQSDDQTSGADLRTLERQRDDGLIAILQALKPLDIGAGSLLNDPATVSSSSFAISQPKTKEAQVAEVRDDNCAPKPDFENYSANEDIQAISPWQDGVQVTWCDGHVSRFHGLWLRDNCACADCVSPLTREQIFDISTVPGDLSPNVLEVDDTGALAIVWPDGHASRIHPGWLRAYCYSDEDCGRKPLHTWDAQFEPPRFDGNQVLKDDGALMEWLEAIDTNGLAILENCPLTPGAVEWFADRISFLRQTNFGRVFDVRSKPDADSNAYTSLELPLHTDLPTRELQPGMQFLLCRVNEATGGDSIMADGFAVAEAIRIEEPTFFETLTTLPMQFKNRSRSSDYRFRIPAILLDDEGGVREIRLGNFLRGPQRTREDQMPRLYEAYRHLIKMTREERFKVRLRLNAGDMSSFNNRRVLHARTAFDSTSGARHLQGCYVDTDELKSRLRILRRQADAGRPSSHA